MQYSVTRFFKHASFTILTVVLAVIVVAGVTTQEKTGGDPSGAGETLVSSDGLDFPPSPPVPDGALSSRIQGELDTLVESAVRLELDQTVLKKLGQTNDPRLAWLLVDLLFFSKQEDRLIFKDVFEELTNTVLSGDNLHDMADRLIAWDTPAPPGYQSYKTKLYQRIDPRWAPFFGDESSDVDWRLVMWGGVLMDDRQDAGPGQRCFRCIPALDDPPVTGAAGGAWYDDDRLIFGVVINGEARAYPKNILQVHEMINDSLGGRRFGLPYCTLCGSAQAFYLDNVDGFQPVLRTSGMLARSNKLMFDLDTMSLIETFSGRALSGPLQKSGIVLEQASVVTSTWGEWKRYHPETTIVAGDGGIPGYSYPIDPLGARDDQGPIFPVGDVDPRLAVQELVLGVIASNGTPVAFPVGRAVLALQAGEKVELEGIRLELDGSGVRAFIGDLDASGHEAFWFGWSQFTPETLVWRR